MAGLDELRARAIEVCRIRGHEMEFTPPHHGERTSIQQGTCKHCNGWVQLDTNPLPNGIDIGGDALALTCCGPTVARARTEFNRTQGVLLDLLERYIPYSRDRARVTEALRQHGGACVQLGAVEAYVRADREWDEKQQDYI